MSIAADNRIAALEARVARLEALTAAPEPTPASDAERETWQQLRRAPFHDEATVVVRRRRGRPPKKPKAAA